MLLHCTRKLFEQIPAELKGASCAAAAPSPIGDWHATVHVIDRRKCLLFCHDRTRHTLFLPGVTKTDLAALSARHKALFLSVLSAAGIADSRVRRASLALGPVVCDARTDRSVLGSMTVLRDDLETLLNSVPTVMDLDPVKASVFLNHRPAVARGETLWPDELMEGLVGAL